MPTSIKKKKKKTGFLVKTSFFLTKPYWSRRNEVKNHSEIAFRCSISDKIRKN